MGYRKVRIGIRTMSSALASARSAFTRTRPVTATCVASPSSAGVYRTYMSAGFCQHFFFLVVVENNSTGIAVPG